MELLMPNWCNNTLEVTGPNQHVQRFKDKAVGHYPWSKEPDEPNPLNFHSLVPIPESILAAPYEDAGYDWENKYWGCKWGSCETRLQAEDGRLVYTFDTAWSPPLELLETVAKDWPALRFVLDYEEPGVGLKGSMTHESEAMLS
jgi:hypothetical protein